MDFLFGKEKIPTIVLTLRLNKIDNYAFALLHEIYHVYMHLINNREQKYIAIEGAEINKCEEEANKFAKCSLIGKDLWNTFLKTTFYDFSTCNANENKTICSST